MSVVVSQAAADTLSRSYLVAGVPCVVTASAALLEYVDASYAPYRVEAVESDPYSIHVAGDGSHFCVRDSRGYATRHPDEEGVAGETRTRLVYHVTGELARRGIYATHAGSLVYKGEALMISGKSGAGKTTLTVALVGHGLGYLSDEFALSAPDARTMLPYRRSLHIRPGTPELVVELAFIKERPSQPIGGGGFQWSLLPQELERAFPACLAEPAPLRHVVLLEPRGTATTSVLEPVSKGALAIELVRSTPAAATDFAGAMERVTRLTEGTRCARLRPGSLASSVEVLLAWLARRDD